MMSLGSEQREPLERREWQWWNGLAPKLLGPLAVVVAALALALSSLATRQLEKQLVRSFESKGEAIALAMATSAEQNLGGDIALVQAAVDANKVIYGIKYIYVVDDRGRPYVHTFAPVFPAELQGANAVALGEVFPDGRRVKIAQGVDFTDAQGQESVIDVAAPVAAGALGVVHVGMNLGVISAQKAELRTQMLFTGCVVAAAGVLVCLLLIHLLVVRPVRELTRVTTLVLRGDLTQSMGIVSRDELGDLADTFSQMVGKLRSVLLTVTRLVEGVADVSRTLAATGATVSSGASTVRERVAETSSSMAQTFDSLRGVEQSVATLNESAGRASSTIEQMAATNERVTGNVETMARSVDDVTGAVDQMATSMQGIARHVDRLRLSVAETGTAVAHLDVAISEIERNAKQTSLLSDVVSSDAMVGVTALEKTLGGIRRIDESSRSALAVIEDLGSRVAAIGTVVDVISHVAERTNLLALNASIIAAQVGEQGAGFVVVADEVKELAQQTANSTIEISELIHDVQAKARKAVNVMSLGARHVGEGVRLGDETATALRKILETTTKSTAMVKAIAAATVEQTRGSRHINESIQGITAAVELIAGAANDQVTRGEQITKSAATMSSLTQQVRRSSQEQAKGSDKVIRSIEQINDMAAYVNKAQKQQTERTAPVLHALETIRVTSERQNGSMTDLERAIGLLQSQSDVLRGEVKRFRVE